MSEWQPNGEEEQLAPEEKQAMTTTDVLEELVFARSRPVTVTTLARWAKISKEEAQGALDSFFTADHSLSHEEQLHGVYSVSGTRSWADPTRRNVHTVVREGYDLEQAKGSLDYVHECSLVAIHTGEIEDLHTIFMQDAFEYFDVMKIEPAQIKSTYNAFTFMRQAPTEKKKVTAGPRKQQLLGAAFASKDKKKVADETKKPDINKLFQKACERTKTPKSSPQKLRPSPFSSLTKKTPTGGEARQKETTPASEERATTPATTKDDEDSNSPVLNRKRQHKIQIDEGDSPVKAPGKRGKTESSKESSRDKSATKEREVEALVARTANPVKRTPKKKVAKIDSDDDLFDAGDSSPEKSAESMEVDEVVPETKDKKRKGAAASKAPSKKAPVATLEQTGGVRRSPRKLSAAPTGPPKKMVKKETTYMDDNGFLVTRVETVAEELTPEEAEEERAKKAAVTAPLQPATKKLNAPEPAKGASKKGSAGQSKISSFFKKT